MEVLNKIYQVIKERAQEPKEGSYTNYLLDKGVDKICKKVGEECAETIIGAKNGDKQELTYEIGDLLYHLLVLMYVQGIELSDVEQELEKRYK